MPRVKSLPDKHIWERLTAARWRSLKTEAINDFWKFLDVIEYMGGTRRFGDVHRELADFLVSTHERRLILMPRGHLKSTLCSVAYVMWRIYQNPNIRILVGTAERELSTDFVRTVKQYFENPDLQRYVWNNRPHIPGPLIPRMDAGGRQRRERTYDASGYNEDLDDGYTEAADKKVVWQSKAIQVLRDQIYKEPTLRATSTGSSVTGQHYDLIIYDDIVTFENSDNTRKAEKVYKWAMDIESVVNPRDEDTGLGEEFVILGTRYYPWDYYAHLTGDDIEKDEDRDEFLRDVADDPLHIILRDIYTKGCHYTGALSQEFHDITHGGKRDVGSGYLWPEGFNKRMEMRLRRSMTARRFASQYLNTYFSDNLSILNASGFVNWHPQDMLKVEPGMVWMSCGKTKDNRDVKFVLRPYIAVDLAASLDKNADYTCIGVGAKTPLTTKTFDDDLFLLDFKMGRWTPTDTCNIIIELAKKWKVPTISVEAVGYQKSFIYTLKEALRQAGLVVAVRAYRPEGEKVARIENALEPLLKLSEVDDTGEMRGRLHTFNWVMANREAIEQVRFFGTSSTVHDDFPDMLTQLKEVAKGKFKKPPSGRDEQLIRAKLRVNSKYGGYR